MYFTARGGIVDR